jgi:hypothetical protein
MAIVSPRSLRLTAVAAMLTLGAATPVVAAEADGFDISGEVDGLYPGAVSTMSAVVTNPQAFVIRVTTISVHVGDASADCPASMLRIDRTTPNVTIAAGATRRIPVDVRMLRRAPDSCQRVVFPLRLVATAVAADGDSDGDGGAPSAPHTALPITGSTIMSILVIATATVTAGSAIKRSTRRRSA